MRREKGKADKQWEGNGKRDKVKQVRLGPMIAYLNQ
jgi:hypothetical protein